MKQSIAIFPIIIFTVLSLVIIFPLLSPGYILTLDTVTMPNFPFPSFFSSSFIFGSLLALVGRLFPTYWLQKIILFAIFFFSGWGMYRLVPVKTGAAKYFAGIFYAVNPFVYERIMAGHWYLLLSYSLFPFIVSNTIEFFANPSRRMVVRLAILSTILINLVIHYSLILAGFLIIYGIIFTLLHLDKAAKIVEYFIVFLGVLFVLNLNWLLPGIIGRSELSAAVSQFNSKDLITFQSVEDKRFGLVFNLLSGYGFWGEVYPYFIVPKNIIFFWPVISVIFIALSFYGLMKLLSEESIYPLTITLVLMFLLSLDLAGGVALKSFANTAFFLYEKLPFLRGFREPQKLIGIVMFCYAFFASSGLSFLVEKMKPSAKYIVIGIFLLLPFIYTPTVFGGFWGQLAPVFYPQSWHEVNNLLNQDKDNYLAVFFPWRQYLRFNFNNKLVIANPATVFFDKPILSSQNYETAYLYSHESRPEALHVEGLLSIEKKKVNLLGDPVDEPVVWGRDLAIIDIKYIILAKDSDWENYQFLGNASDLKKIFDSEDIILYQNLKWGIEEIPEEIDST